MQEFDKPSAWRYLFLGFLIGWLGSFIIIKVALLDLVRFLLIGIFMGLATGISSCSIKKTIVAILAGLVAGSSVFIYYSHLGDQDFLYQVPPLLFWYATSIILCLMIIDRKEKNIIIYTFFSLFASLVVTGIIYALSWLSVGLSIGQAFAGSKSIDTSQIMVGIIAIMLFNLSINIGRYEWKLP